MTDLQLSHLQQILIERNRRLVSAYTAHDGRTYAVSRPSGQHFGHMQTGAQPVAET